MDKFLDGLSYVGSADARKRLGWLGLQVSEKYGRLLNGLSLGDILLVGPVKGALMTSLPMLQ